MRNTHTFVVITLAFLLSACGSGTASEVAATPTVSSTPDTAAQATQAPYTDAATPCKPFSLIDQVFQPPLVPIPEVTDEDWVNGPADAKVTFIVYDDMQCPYCAQFQPIINEVLAQFPEDARLVYRHWPLSFHDKAVLSAQALEAAGRQGKFFEMVDTLYAKQNEWNQKTPEEYETYVKEIADSLGLDTTQFATDLNSTEIVEKIKAETEKSNLLGSQLSEAYGTGFGTPTVLINGTPYLQQRSVELLSSIVRLVQGKGEEVLECPTTVIDAQADYQATILTSKGEIVIDLLEDDAPQTVNNFVYLVQNAWYDNNAFFVVRENFVLTGDKVNTGFGGPGYAFLDEIKDELKFDKEGVVGMYSFGPGTNGSQFFITKEAMDALNGNYTIFGQVIEGLDVLKSLALHETTASLDSADRILGISITTK
jgi:cyclophilin family peptidyl-prolyl cis-trans isomerase/protein-disulfide isomerase